MLNYYKIISNQKPFTKSPLLFRSPLATKLSIWAAYGPHTKKNIFSPVVCLPHLQPATTVVVIHFIVLLLFFGFLCPAFCPAHNGRQIKNLILISASVLHQHSFVHLFIHSQVLSYFPNELQIVLCNSNKWR